MEMLLILWVFVRLVQCQNNPDDSNYVNPTSIKVAEVEDKVIVLTKYNGQGYLGYFKDSEGFSIKESTHPVSITATLQRDEKNFVIVDNSYLDPTVDNDYKTQIITFDSDKLEQNSAEKFNSVVVHSAKQDFCVFRAFSSKTYIQAYIEGNQYCLTSLQKAKCTTVNANEELVNFYCTSEENIYLVCQVFIKANDKISSSISLYDKETFSKKGYPGMPTMRNNKDIRFFKAEFLDENSFFYCYFSLNDNVETYFYALLYVYNDSRPDEKMTYIGKRTISERIEQPSKVSIRTYNKKIYITWIEANHLCFEKISFNVNLDYEVADCLDEINMYSLDILPTSDHLFKVFYVGDDGPDYINGNSFVFCHGFSSELSVNSEIEFAFAKRFFCIVGKKDECDVGVGFATLASEGELIVKSSQESVEQTKQYDLNTEFVYRAGDSEGIFSFMFEAKQTKIPESPTCFERFKVFSCLKMCSSCEKDGTTEDNKCKECAEGYYPKEGDTNPNNCYKNVEGYYLGVSGTKKMFLKCSANCKSCSGSADNCSTCFDGLYLFLKGKSKECTATVPKGYFVNEENQIKVIQKCKFNCANKKNENRDFKEFCNETKTEILQKCSEKITVDETLIVNSYPLKDNTAKVVEFISKSPSEKNETIQETLKEVLESKEEKKTKAIFDSIHLINQYLDYSEDLTDDQKKSVFQQLIEILSKNLTCLELKELFKDEEESTILSAALTVNLMLSKKELITADELLAMTILNKCIIQHGSENFIGDSYEKKLNQEDFVDINGNAITKMVTILNNVSLKNDTIDAEKFNKSLIYQFNNSIILSPSRTNTKDLIENVSQMISKFQGSQGFTFNGTSFISVGFSELDKNGYYIQNDIMVTIRDCSNINKGLAALKAANLKARICIPYSSIRKNFSDISSISVIDYTQYPLLNQNITSKVNKNFISIVLRDKDSNIIPIKGLEEKSFEISIKKPEGYRNFNECLFFNEEDSTLRNTDCSTIDVSDEYIHCACNHLTDFSISSINPVNIFKDIIRLFRQSRIMKSLDVFKNLNAKNAYVLYTVLVILVIYFVLLFFAVRYDLNKDEDFFVTVIEKEKPCCFSKEEVRESLKDMKKEFNRKLKKGKGETMIEMTTQKPEEPTPENLPRRGLTTERESNLEIRFDELKYRSTKSIRNKAALAEEEEEFEKKRKGENFYYIKEYWFLFKDFFLNDFWFCCIFLRFDSEITKTNFLTIFAIKFISALSISTIFTECGESEEIGDSYNNRDLAVAIATIIVNEIPFIIFEVLLGKTQMPKKKSTLYNKYRINAIYKHIIVYTIFVAILILGTINTTWVSLDSEGNGFHCKFLTDFYLSIAIDCFAYQIIQIILKSLLYVFILNGSEGSCLRGTLLFLVSIVPWMFNLYG